MKRLFLLVLLLPTIPAIAQHVRIERSGERWRLIANGQPVFVKGVVGHTFLDKAKRYGANSIRLDHQKQGLDRVHALGLTALVNLPVDAERYGFDYSDSTAVRKQKENILGIVRATKNHPAVLMWAIGNELDYIPGNKPYNLLLWNAVEEIAAAIHQEDPNHPVMTVIGTSLISKIADIVERCPSLDLLGVNTYGDILKMDSILLRYGWTKPYVYTEWGPKGYWEVPKTSWKAPFEQTGLEKVNFYRDNYERAILAYPDRCLGSYVFYWSGFKQETTHTWFCLFDRQGNETPVVKLMARLWGKTIPGNSAPVVDSLNILGFAGYESITCKPASSVRAKVSASDPDGDRLRLVWEIRPEAQYAAYAGQGEKEPQPVKTAFQLTGLHVAFRAPSRAGAYRLFVYAYDDKGHYSSANLPFRVEP